MAKRKWGDWNKIISSEKFVNKITKGYVRQAPSKKDKRSKNITSSDKKRALAYLKINVKGLLESSPELTMKEAVNQVVNSTAFTSKGETAAKNWQKQLKEFNINVKRTSLEYDEKESKYKIIAGKYKNYYTVIVHHPGQDPSYAIELIPASQIVNFV